MDTEELINTLKSSGINYQTVNGKIVLYPEKNQDVIAYYFLLKLVSLYNQGYQCCSCEKSIYLDLTIDLHHALLTRNDVRGLHKDLRSLINCNLNTIVLCRQCHQTITKEKSLEFLSQLYGIDALRQWYYNQPLKSWPRRI